jgi:hypothetical protein
MEVLSWHLSGGTQKKLRKLSVRIASSLAKIRSEEFLNKKNERYPFANSFGEELLV